MTRQERLFVIALIINLIVALIYLVYGILIGAKKNGRVQYYINTCVMVLCPVIGPLFFFVGFIIFKYVLKEPVDLADVIFSKDKKESIVKADEERELNIAPIEESMAVSDKASLRRLMLNVIRGDVSNSLHSISMALGSTDSEASHYAASILVDELNSFRMNAQKLYNMMLDEEEEISIDEKCDFAIALVECVNPILKQRILADIEQRDYVYKVEEACKIVYKLQPSRMTSEIFDVVCMRLLDIKDYDHCAEWCERAMDKHPNALSSYTSRLKLYFSLGNRDKFFEVLEETKKSDVTIDQETLELIRIFQK